MAKYVYAVGIGYRINGKLKYIKTFLYMSKKIISRNDYDDIIFHNFNPTDYENLLNLHISSSKVIVCIFNVDDLSTKEAELILLINLFRNGDFNFLDTNDDSDISKLHSTICSWYIE